MPEQEQEPATILGHLTSAGIEISQVIGHLNTAERHLWHAYNLTVINGRPSVQVEYLRGEVQALNQIVDETVSDLIRKSAEVEAKSAG